MSGTKATIIDALGQLAQFSKPLTKSPDEPSADGAMTVRKAAVAFAPGRAAHIGGHIPTVAPFLVGPRRKLESFKPIALKPEGIPIDRIAVVPHNPDRLFGADPEKSSSSDQQANPPEEDDEVERPKEDPTAELGPSATPYSHRGSTLVAPFTDLLKPLNISKVTALSESMESNGDISKIHNVLVEAVGKDKPGRATGNRTFTTGTHNHLDYEEAPLSNIYEIFDKISQKVLRLDVENCSDSNIAPFQAACKVLEESPLRIFTMCSGTEAPILAMDLVKQSLQKENVTFNYEHVASAEIEPFKQGYIELNFHPPLLFRDVTEFNNSVATTAYGTKTHVPGQCDVVVAGSACVDYSSLNAHIKGFGEKGESYATMMGVMNYCLIHSPSIIILENIKGAPWQKICDKWHKDIGYDVVAVTVDTKDFYIPQTRQRGYMIGFNRKRATDANFNTKKARESWVSFFGQLSQRASSPYTEFIYANDSPENEKVRTMVDGTAQPSKKDIAWALCRHRYMNFRSTKHYGTRRPYTNWQENGTSRPPDFTWYWLKVQRDRVLDTLDIAVLRYTVDRDYDMSAKSRTVDLSQNIDRDLDSKHWGIVGCLTSTGLLYDTYRGGVVSGVEALILQGIPVDDLILSKLSMKHMIDLAGNAMTSTVIGPALLAAVAAGVQDDKTIFFPTAAENRQLNPEILTESALLDTDQCKSALTSAGLRERKQNLTSRQNMTLSELKEFARNTRQLCSCEGVTGKKETDFLLCEDCGHSVCTKCGKNPVHNYCLLDSSVSSRKDPLDFINEIQRLLPRSLKLYDEQDFAVLKTELDAMAAFSVEKFEAPGRDLAVPTQKPFLGRGTFATALKEQFSTRELANQDIEALNTTYRELICEAVLEPFHFRGVKRDTAWKVEYSSAKATLVLFLTPVTDLDSKNKAVDLPSVDCFWLLTVACPQGLAQGSMLRENLQHPIARMFPNDTLLTGSWEFWNYDATISTTTKVEQLGSFFSTTESKAGITHINFTSLEISERLRLTFKDKPEALPKVCEFEYLDNCGTPNSLLYRSVKQISSPGDGNKRYAFLFLDPGHLQDAIYDSMVIAFSHDRIPRNEMRLTLVTFASGWRPVRDLGEGKQGLFRPQVKCKFTGLWRQHKTMTLAATSNEGIISIWEPQPSHDNFLPAAQCSDASVIVYGIELPLVPELTNSFGEETKSIVLDLADKRGKLKPLKFILGCLDVPAALSNEHYIAPAQSILQLCESCAPSNPTLVWKWVRQRKSGRLVLRPMDDPSRSREHERALKSRPLIASAELHITNAGAYLQLSINPMTLLHRVIAPMIRSEVGRVPPEASWKIAKYNALKSATPYKIPILGGNETNTPLQASSEFSRKLWESQKKTLNWMVQVERDSPTFEEQTVQEHPIQPLEWNLIAQASRQATVKGAILADGVGTGKTTVILALIGMGRVAETERPKPSTVTRKGSKATLVLVPANLIEQWVEQTTHCRGQTFVKKHVLVVEKLSNLNNLDAHEIARAKIILVSLNIFEDAKYWEKLRDMCYAPNVPTASGRAQIQWLQAAMQSLDELCEASNQFRDEQGLQDCRKKLHKQLAEKEFASFSGFRKRDMAHIDPDTLKAPEISLDNQQQHQNAYPEAVERSDLSASFDCDWNEDNKAAPRTPNGNLLPLLHMFFFDRIVVDEFQYLSPKAYAAVSTLRSEKTWLLSGTPPIDDVDSVDAMARLLGTRITMRADEFVCQGFAPEKATAILKERSYVEEFQAFNDVDSVAVGDNHREQARAFLGLFAKSNTLTTANLQVVSHIVAVKPQAIERAVFIQYYSTLNNEAIKYADKDLVFKQLDDIREDLNPKLGGTQPDTADAIIRALSQSRNAHMAMISCYAVSALKLSDHDEALSLKSLFQGLQEELDRYLAHLKERIIEATGYWFEGEGTNTIKKESGDLGKWITETLRDGRLGDQDLTLAVDYMFGEAQDNHPAPKELLVNIQTKTKDKEAEEKPEKTKWNRKDGSVKTRNKEMQIRTADLRDIVQKTVKTMRQQRLMYTLGCIDSDAKISCAVCGRSSGGTGRFPHPPVRSDRSKKVPRAPQYQDFMLLATCGHVFCKDCFKEEESRKDSDLMCLAAGCDLPKEPHNIYDAASFCHGRTAKSSDVGSRASAIIEKVNEILDGHARRPRDVDDYIVIFVQYIAQAKELSYAFETNGIPLANACVDPGLLPVTAKRKALTAAREEIQNFKINAMKGNKKVGKGFYKDLKENDTSAKLERNPHVLMLMIDSEDAAGWNLQVCNHVVLAAPYVATSAFRYNSVLKQAVGRALRVGQDKVVNVYQYALAYTTEVNILEERREERGGGKFMVVGLGEESGWVAAEEAPDSGRVSGPPLLVGSDDAEPEEEGESNDGEAA